VAKAKAIIKRRKTVISTRKITKTMELVSTAKYQQVFSRVANAKPFRVGLQDVMHDLAAAAGTGEHPLLERRPTVRNATVLVLTSNRGLAGGFNTNLLKLARTVIAEQRAAGATVRLFVVGKKGIIASRYAGEKLEGAFSHFGDKPQYAEVQKLADEFAAEFVAGRTDRVLVVYQRYQSAAVQRPHVETLLPLEPAAAGAPAGGKPAASSQVEYLYSPAAPLLMQQLLPLYVRTLLYHLFLETVVGEQRARMVAMKNATDNADTMIKSLTRLYNRARQSQITNEISEIMGGVEALK
jgi:F-type H+-transporting ATPase subunit gamma